MENLGVEFSEKYQCNILFTVVKKTVAWMTIAELQSLG